MIEFQKVGKSQVMRHDEWYIWGASTCKYKNKYYMFVSGWEKKYGFQGWVEHSTIFKAVSEHLDGPYRIERELTELKEQSWSREVLHNPSIYCENDKYYLFYIGTFYEINERTKSLDEKKEIYRYNQCIGVAEITDLENGAFQPSENNPVLRADPNKWDGTYVTNPTVCRYKGAYFMLYKALIKDRLPDIVLNLGIAKSEAITGPYKRVKSDPLSKCNVEDPFIWAEDNKVFMIAKDMTGETVGKVNAALISETEDIFNWDFTKSKPAYFPEIDWENGKEEYLNVERPQIFFEDGKPVCLFNAVRTYEGATFNVARIIENINL